MRVRVTVRPRLRARLMAWVGARFRLSGSTAPSQPTADTTTILLLLLLLLLTLLYCYYCRCRVNLVCSSITHVCSLTEESGTCPLRYTALHCTAL